MKLAPPTCREVKALLTKLGFTQVKTNRGSHEKWKHPDFNGRARSVTVDCPKSPFSAALIKSMACQAGCPHRAFWEAATGKRCHTTLIG